MNRENSTILSFLHSSTTEQLVRYCFNNHLLPPMCACQYCGTIMKIKTSKDSNDGFVWQCRHYTCSKFQTTLSIRTNSVLKNLNLGLRQILIFTFHWSCSLLNSEILQFVAINKNSAGKIRKLLIDKIKLYFSRYPIKIGGPFKQVDIDETMLSHTAKAHRGRTPRQQIYALCIKEVGSNAQRGFCKVLHDRSARSILPIIYRVVLPGTTIHTDEWSSYNQLSRSSDYTHLTVCHKYNFVNPITGTHTQNVESFNSKLKLRIKKMKGIISGRHDEFCLEFMWLDRFGNTGFDKVIELLLIN